MSDINGFTTVEYFNVQDIKEDFSLNQLQSRVSTGGLSSLLPVVHKIVQYTLEYLYHFILIFLMCINTEGLNAGIITCFTGKVMETIKHITSCLIKEPEI